MKFNLTLVYAQTSMNVEDKHAQEMENATILLTDSNVNAKKDSKESCAKKVSFS